MMRTIWKFPIAIGPITTIEVPAGAPIRLAALDPASGGPAIWVELDTDAPRVERRFVVHGTGHEIPGTDGGYPQPIHVGSMIDRSFVWHIFEGGGQGRAGRRAGAVSGAYLPVVKAVRDRANAYLASMAARGFVPPPMIEVVRKAEAAERYDPVRAAFEAECG